MQTWSSFLSLLALTGTSLALPTALPSTADTSIRVALANNAQELATQTSFTQGKRDAKRPVGSSGPFTTVELTLGKDVVPQTYRCKVLDHQHQEIVVVRGTNIDKTFGDGGKGAWTFRDGAREVEKIVCDPTFVAQPLPPAEEKDTDVVVALFGPSELATQTAFQTIGTQGGVEILPPTASEGPYNQVQLRLGEDVVNPALRCRLTDLKGKVITLKRGDNVQNTFTGGAPWNFLKPMKSRVGKIECNDIFKLGSP